MSDAPSCNCLGCRLHHWGDTFPPDPGEWNHVVARMKRYERMIEDWDNGAFPADRDRLGTAWDEGYDEGYSAATLSVGHHSRTDNPYRDDPPAAPEVAYGPSGTAGRADGSEPR